MSSITDTPSRRRILQPVEKSAFNRLATHQHSEISSPAFLPPPRPFRGRSNENESAPKWRLFRTDSLTKEHKQNNSGGPTQAFRAPPRETCGPPISCRRDQFDAPRAQAALKPDWCRGPGGASRFGKCLNARPPSVVAARVLSAVAYAAVPCRIAARFCHISVILEALEGTVAGTSAGRGGESRRPAIGRPAIHIPEFE